MKKRYSMLVIVGLILWGGCLTHAQVQSITASRQAWEYKTFIFEIDGQKTTLYEDGRQLPATATPVNRAPELGAQGWELVSITSMPTAFLESVSAIGSKSIFATKLTYVYWFKRPKSSN
ncbi:MAG: hypothetical protein ACT4O9_16835 [Blastocatellia bacterium]